MDGAQLKPLVGSIFTNIDKDLSDISILKKIQTKTGIKPSHLFLGVSFLVLFLALADIFADILTTLFGMIYPAYMSWKAIQKKDEEQKKIWLTYWIVFGSLSTIDDSLSFILHFIPGFFAFRFIIYLWMFYPRANNGANIIYVAIKPFMEKLREKIDDLKASAKKSA